MFRAFLGRRVDAKNRRLFFSGAVQVFLIVLCHTGTCYSAGSETRPRIAATVF
ncbi:hypothetical protein BN132_3348 [Cronobacter turicensis 564]|nr:hypothetical protein BN132_3348 [Cronobacter turicensis 564]